MQNKLIFWWSTWDFYRVTNAVNTDDLISEYFAIPETNALEIMFHGKDNIEHKMSHEILKHNFSHYSIHAPAYNYQNDDKSHTILKEFQNLCKIFPIANIVVHPDTVVDRSIFRLYDDLPISIENMDERKKMWQTVEDIWKILEQNPNFWLTLDLQHCFVNDPSMKLADDFHKTFWNKIVQYHIAWYDPEYLHYPLFKTKQNNIIQALQKKDIPIIIESTFDEKSDLKKEIEYILEFIL